MANEIRRGYFGGEYVIFSPARKARPHAFRKPAEKSGFVCPFCPGNERMTPPSIKEIRDGSGWSMRLIPNKFPAVTNAMPFSQKKGFYGRMAASGMHEVIIEHPSHGWKIQDSQAAAAAVIRMYAARYSELMAEKNIKYVQIWRNYGKEGGASVSHPHSQLIALPFLPPDIKCEVVSGSCAYCRIIKSEMKSERMVMKSRGFAAFVPYAAKAPYETWIFPLKHKPTLAELSEKEVAGFADILCRVLRAIEKITGDTPYNYFIYQMPGKYHLSLRIMPVINIIAGFEKSTGIYINTLLPEDAAMEMRAAI